MPHDDDHTVSRIVSLSSPRATEKIAAEAHCYEYTYSRRKKSSTCCGRVSVEREQQQQQHFSAVRIQLLSNRRAVKTDFILPLANSKCAQGQ